MTFKIDKGMPIPPRTGHRLYPFASMERGDSFPVDTTGQTKDEIAATMKRIIAATQSHRRRHGVSFTVRLMPEENAIRVWRDE